MCINYKKKKKRKEKKAAAATANEKGTGGQFEVAKYESLKIKLKACRVGWQMQYLV